MSQLQIAGRVVAFQGMRSGEAAVWRTLAMECGAICDEDATTSELIVVPEGVALLPNSQGISMLTTTELRVVADGHRPRQVRGTEFGAPRQCDMLAGHRIALIGALRGYDQIVCAATALGAMVVPAPEADVSLAVFGRGLDAVPQRLQAIRSRRPDLRSFSEWEFFDLIEPAYSPFRADRVQRALWLRLLGLPEPPPSAFCAGF